MNKNFLDDIDYKETYGVWRPSWKFFGEFQKTPVPKGGYAMLVHPEFQETVNLILTEEISIGQAFGL